MVDKKPVDRTGEVTAEATLEPELTSEAPAEEAKPEPEPVDPETLRPAMDEAWLLYEIAFEAVEEKRKTVDEARVAADAAYKESAEIYKTYAVAKKAFTKAGGKVVAEEEPAAETK